MSPYEQHFRVAVLVLWFLPTELGVHALGPLLRSSEVFGTFGLCALLNFAPLLSSILVALCAHCCLVGSEPP